MKTYNKQIQTAVVLNANINGPAMPMKNIFMYSIASTITGTPTGTIKLQVSNDPETNDTLPLSNNPPTIWNDVAGSTFTVTAAGKSFWNVTDVAYNYVRVVYTDTSSGASTATMTTVYNGKGI